MPTRLCCVASTVILLVCAGRSLAAPPAFNASVSGIELLPQSIAGAAIFIFNVAGEIDGRQRGGWGWIAVKHADLPEVELDSSPILGGGGAIYIGLRWYDVDVNGGELILTDTKGTDVFDDAFDVVMDVDICRRGECAAHGFEGVLDHGPFPPTIAGPLFTALP